MSETLTIPTATELDQLVQDAETREVHAYLAVTVTDDDREPAEEACGF
ncbi:hypothetical protein GCM10010300_76070 [Streptomyces olivaceoviridis]|nr:hypothetical protein [Streptomyces olivaceoviridis]GGZ21012.1 hypothetical protein GCM10010300_76070 [Streptomyces olivaceoviridis]